MERKRLVKAGDLDGHSVSSTSGAADTITNGTSNSRDIHIYNGKVSGGRNYIRLVDTSNGGEFVVENLILGSTGISTDSGIYIQGGTAAGTGARAQVRNNILFGPSNWDIELVNIDTAKVEDNEISGASSGGIRISNGFSSTIARNTIFLGDNGIELDTSANNQLLDNNVSDNGADGITLNNSDRNTLDRNDSSENGSGIVLVNGATNNLIQNNNLSGNLQWGIGLLSGSARNSILRNTCSANGQGTTLYAGIYVDGATTTANTIESNVLSGNIGYGLKFFNGPPVRNIISLNRTVENTLGGMSGQGSELDLNNNYCGEIPAFC